MAYTTTSLVSSYLDRALTADEQALFLVLLPAVTRWIDQTLSSQFDTVSATERFYDAEGAVIDIDPVQSITDVKAYDSDASTSYDYTEGTEYVTYPLNETVKNQIVSRSKGGFTRGMKRVGITGKFTEYDFTNSKVPEDIQLLATRLIASQLRALSADAVVDDASVKKESVEGHSIEYVTSADYLTQVSSSDPIVAGILNTRRQLMVG
ncbi:MAG: hypothetical protein WC822_07510 [Candidatus Paceibacterota bacterium]|jgi:hypothetical protein